MVLRFSRILLFQATGDAPGIVKGALGVYFIDAVFDGIGAGEGGTGREDKLERLRFKSSACFLSDISG
jgi:hypothetical protein